MFSSEQLLTLSRDSKWLHKAVTLVRQHIAVRNQVARVRRATSSAAKSHAAATATNPEL